MCTCIFPVILETVRNISATVESEASSGCDQCQGNGDTGLPLPPPTQVITPRAHGGRDVPAQEHPRPDVPVLSAHCPVLSLSLWYHTVLGA